MAGDRTSGPSPTRLLAAFAAVYVIWGSTYLAIVYAIETLPPFLMAGVRFLVAGGTLYLWARLRGAPRPLRIHWRSALIIGGLLLLFGNGLVVWAEQYVTSGQAALLVSTVPIWTVLLEWLRPGGERPSLPVLAGVTMGFVGLILLIDPGDGGPLHLGGVLALLWASIAWTIGSLYARRAPLPDSAVLTNGIEMLAGGGLLLLVGLLRGEWRGLELAAISTQSMLALLYLIVFGSLIAFSAYIYILTHATPTRASTYAYVNPVVAVILGWLIAAEPLTPKMVLATTIIVSSVALLTLRVRPTPRRSPLTAGADDIPRRPRRRFWRRARSGDRAA